MSSFGNAIMGFFGGASTGGGGTSTGVNGLNGTTNIGLGGTMTGDVTINGNGTNTLYFGQNGNITFETYGTANLNSNGLNFTSVLIVSTSQDGISLSSYLTSDNTQRTYFLQSYNQIYTKKNNTNLGLNLDFTSRVFTLGDYANAFGKNKLVVDDITGVINTQTLDGNNGFYISNNDSLFGCLNGANYCGLLVNYASKTVSALSSSAVSDGLSLDFINDIYKFGSYNSIGNYIQINDTNNSIETLTSNLIFTGASLQSGSSGGNSGQHLVITLNGTQYKIDLKNP